MSPGKKSEAGIGPGGGDKPRDAKGRLGWAQDMEVRQGE